MTLTLPWFPPAPAAGPASLLELPPDDWALEPKIDGTRVIWLEGRAFTRQGSLLGPTKGAVRLTQLLAGIPHHVHFPGTAGRQLHDRPVLPGLHQLERARR